MIPEPGKTLTDIAMRIATHLVPDIQTDFGQADGGLISGLLLTLAQDYERAVFNRMTDVDEIKALCAQCAANADYPEQHALAAFIDTAPHSLLLADVTTLHAQAFTLLIDLHAWAEQHDDALNLEVWRLLRRHSERNKFELPGL